MNLYNKELKKQFEKDLNWAFNKIKKSNNPAAHISIIFTSWNNIKFEKQEITYFASDIKYKNVYISVKRFKKPNIIELNQKATINILLNNLGYSAFHLIKRTYRHGQPEVQGSGEYWGVDYITLHYHREKEEK